MTRWLAPLALTGAALVAVATSASAEPYRWPAPGPVGVNAYYDHSGKDWRCGNNTYNGHKGTDLGVPRNTEVLAGATGQVNHRTDGYGDGFLGSTDGGGFGNAIALFHGGGDETIYGHMTAGSGLPALNSTVGCSGHVGRSGSSGNVTGPHLHFETRIGVSQASYYSGAADDPYAGACGGPLSYWVNQNNGSPTTDCPGGPPPALVDNAAFVADVTIPDGTEITDGAAFVKTWRLRNTGTSTWGGGFDFVHVAGPDFGGGTVGGVSAGPGAEVNITVNMVASGSGVLRSSWQMSHGGTHFGTTVWVEIHVVPAPPPPDADGDGVPAGQDCNDSDPTIHPGAVENCDGVDSNCDGTGDDGLTVVCCATGVATCNGGAWSACSVSCDEPPPGDPPVDPPVGDSAVITGGCSAGSASDDGRAAGLVLGLATAVSVLRRRRSA